MPRVVPLSERKIKPPDDPTIMVDGVPKISVNANKKEIAEFLKIHKKLHNKKVGVYGYREGPSGKSLRKTSEQLRVDLISGGHMIGEAVSKKNPSRRGPSTAPANIAAKEAKEKQISEIKLNGWTSEPVQPPPTQAVINMSGYGGLALPLPATAGIGLPYVTREPTEEELAHMKAVWLAGNQAGKDARAAAAAALNEQTLTLEPEAAQEPEPQLQPEEPEPAPESTAGALLVRYGVDYWIEDDTNIVYRDKSRKILVGKFNDPPYRRADVDQELGGQGRGIIFVNQEARDYHERLQKMWEKTEEPEEPEPENSDSDDFEFPESDGWSTGAVTLPPAVADSIAPVDLDSDDYDSDDDLVEDTSVTDPFSHEGIDYHVGFDYVKMYKDAEGKILVGTLNEDLDEILWKNAAFAAEHEARRAEYIRNSQ